MPKVNINDFFATQLVQMTLWTTLI